MLALMPPSKSSLNPLANFTRRRQVAQITLGRPR